MNYTVNHLGTIVFFLQFLLVLTQWAAATYASDLKKVRRIKAASMVLAALLTVTVAVLSIYVGTLDNSVRASGAEGVQTCQIEYQKSFGLSLNMLISVFCLLVSLGYIYYGTRLRRRVAHVHTKLDNEARQPSVEIVLPVAPTGTVALAKC